MNFSLCPGVASGEAGFRSPREKVSTRGFGRFFKTDVWRRNHFYWDGFVIRKRKKRQSRESASANRCLRVAGHFSPMLSKEGDPGPRVHAAHSSRSTGLRRLQCTFLNTCLQTTPCTLIS